MILFWGKAVVAFGKTFESFEKMPDGRIIAHSKDGSSAEGDVLRLEAHATLGHRGLPAVVPP